jgi:acetoin utilization protein AcuB
MTLTFSVPGQATDTPGSPLCRPAEPLRVCDIMSVAPVTIPASASVCTARTLMQQCNIRHLPVLEDGRLVGILSDRDVRLLLPSPATSLSVREIPPLLDKLTVGAVMTRFVMAVTPDCPVTEAIGRILGHKIGALPVLKDRQVVGIMTRTDVLRAFLRSHTAAGEASV